MPQGLIYFADPMCSWCWGFSPVIQQVQDTFSKDLPLRLIVGGLQAGAEAPMDETAKAEIREHWQHVQALTGAEFNPAFFQREAFVYDTEPACRAMVVVQTHAPSATLPFLHHLQKAFYVENRDITARAVLLSLAETFGFQPRTFAGQFDDPGSLRETRNHFSVTRQMGIRGFPALLAVDERGQHVITSGYGPQAEVCAAIRNWLEEGREADSGSRNEAEDT